MMSRLQQTAGKLPPPSLPTSQHAGPASLPWQASSPVTYLISYSRSQQKYKKFIWSFTETHSDIISIVSDKAYVVLDVPK